MTIHDALKVTDPDLASCEAALKQAAENALRLAIQTTTPFYVSKTEGSLTCAAAMP